ncbi:MAG: hypothetical protein U0L59_00880 [Faecalimonas sp.]|nr:hypothetical protein [Faecalimonas sp.]
MRKMVLSQKKSIQKKLLAATSMLLVACIMLISASYAWFTLSTAPEIKGITTTIGANGNLEIALADASTWADPDGTVKTTVGAGNLGSGLDTNAVKNVNITWGNLIDVSNGYGLDKVSLLPSRLNLAASGEDWTVSSLPLKRPIYGADGRVMDLKETVYAQYNGTDYLLSDANGVRIIGSASGMTDRQLAYRSAKVALANAIADAKAAAKTSLEANGTALANIVVQKAVTDNPTYTQTEVEVIKNVLTGVSTAQADMETAWEAAVISYAASKAGENIEGLGTEEAYLAFKAKMEAKSYTVADGALTADGVSMALPGDFATYYTKIQEIKTNVASATTKVTALESKDSISWEELRTALDYIVKANVVTVNGLKSDEIKANLSKLISAVTSGGIQVEMPSGAGVYADIADFCENYSATVELKNITYPGTDMVLGSDEQPVKATMKTVSNVSPAYFVAANNVVTNALAPAGTGAANNKLSDMYGYTIDYYMRTNASNAKLLLQVNEAQRIYSDSTNEDTLGSGSNMTFTSSDTNFTTTQMLKLMGAIRVVFMLPTENGGGNILAVAKLDTENADVAGSIVKADLKLCEYSVDTTNGNILQVDNFKTTQEITAMTQNQAMKLSTLVYLDGDQVTNAMVANASKSMSGTLNLQFATDQKLVPMQDAALMGVKKEEENQTP